MAIFGTFYHKLGNVWPQEYIADNGEVFYLRRRAGEQLVFIAAGRRQVADELADNKTLFCHSERSEESLSQSTVNAVAVVEYPATAQTDADGNEHCTIEREDTLLHLNANECRLGGSKQTWHERRKIIDNIKS